MENKFSDLFVGALVEMIDTVRIEQGGPAFDAVDFIAFLQQKFSKVCTILAGDACY